MGVLDIVSKAQLAELRDAGFVVINRVPTQNMQKAFYAKQWPECVNFNDGFHRMIAESIRGQAEDE